MSYDESQAVVPVGARNPQEPGNATHRRIDTEIRPALVLPAVDAHGMRQAMAAYQELCAAVLDDSDYQTIRVRGGAKKFKTRSAWQKLAVGFGISTCIVSQEETYDDAGCLLRARVVVRATAPNGRSEESMGACSLYERCCVKPCPQTRYEGHRCCPGFPTCNGAHAFSKPDHDIPATAETRARNRACANLFAFGELTAEEMGDEPSKQSDLGLDDVPRPRPAFDRESSPARASTEVTETRPGTVRLPARRTQERDSQVADHRHPVVVPGHTDAPASVMPIEELRDSCLRKAVLVERAERISRQQDVPSDEVIVPIAHERCLSWLQRRYGETPETATRPQLDGLLRLLEHRLQQLEAAA